MYLPPGIFASLTIPGALGVSLPGSETTNRPAQDVLLYMYGERLYCICSYPSGSSHVRALDVLTFINGARGNNYWCVCSTSAPLSRFALLELHSIHVSHAVGNVFCRLAQERDIPVLIRMLRNRSEASAWLSEHMRANGVDASTLPA